MVRFVCKRKDDEMFCTQCGNEVEQHARFCSKCGQETSSATATTPPGLTKKVDRDMEMHINILGWLLIGSGILTAILGMIVLFGGQIIRHLPPDAQREMAGIQPFLIWITSVVGLGIIALAAGT